MFNFNEKFTANRMLGCSQNNSDSRKFKTKAVSSQTIRSPNYKKRIRLESIRKLQAEVIPKTKKNIINLEPSATGGTRRPGAVPGASDIAAEPLSLSPACLGPRDGISEKLPA